MCEKVLFFSQRADRKLKTLVGWFIASYSTLVGICPFALRSKG